MRPPAWLACPVAVRATDECLHATGAMATPTPRAAITSHIALFIAGQYDDGPGSPAPTR